MLGFSGSQIQDVGGFRVWVVALVAYSSKALIEVCKLKIL